jgi:hypothetical protein
VQLVNLLMQVLIVFLSIGQLLLQLKLSSSQNILSVPSIIPLLHHTNQHALGIPIGDC